MDNSLKETIRVLDEDISVDLRQCELCSNIKNYKECEHGNQLKDIFYDKEEDKYILVLELFRFEYSEISINYCPMCGRKLKGGVQSE